MKWAAVISAGDAHQVAALRLLGDVEVLAESREVWLRGPQLDDALDLALRKLSGAERFIVEDGGELVPVGARVPLRRLPEGNWIPLSRFVIPRAPTAALAGQPADPARLRLVRCSDDRSANVLVTEIASWLAYASSAPQIRLSKLTFAAAADGRIVVRGRPLPPINARLLAESAGIAVPCGYCWQPAADAETVRAVFGLGPDDLAILDPDGTATVISQNCFVAASRSAVRLTAQELANG